MATDLISESMATECFHEKGGVRDNCLTDNQKGHHASLYAQDLDQAYWYVQDHAGTDATSPAEVRRILMKVDFCIVPIIFLCYTMQFIDKVLLNYAAVMGLSKDLKLKGNNLSNTATAFFIAYLIAEIPNAMALQWVPIAKWLGANMVLWGIAAACTAAAKDYHSLLAARIFLGILEAAMAPSLMLLSSQWYTKSEAAPRFSIWYAGLGLGQILGGVISYGFQGIQPPSFSGWRALNSPKFSSSAPVSLVSPSDKL